MQNEQYKLYESDSIKENYHDFVKHCNVTYDKIVKIINSKDSTWNFGAYNLFTETATSPLFFILFSELRTFIRDYNRQIGGSDNDMIWMQSWLNYHQSHEVLDWHGHPWDFHGYISVDPKNTKTVFQDWEIHNEVGQVYIGPGADEYYHHKVQVLEAYEGNRITIGFDCTKQQGDILNEKFIPIL